MSGMEPLAALGLVCNIFQLVEVGSQTYELIKSVYQRGSINNSLNEKFVMLESISKHIKPVDRPAKKHEQQLVEIAESCARAARQLREEINYLIESSKKGKLSFAVKAAFTTPWRKPRLERLKNELDEAEKLMHSGLLVQIMSTVNDIPFDLNDVAVDVRSFLQEYWKGHRDTNRVITREGLETRMHFSTTIQDTHEAVERVGQDVNKLALNLDDRVDQAKQVVETIQDTNEAVERVGQDLSSLALNLDDNVDQDKRERLLRSLKYEGFNERRNEVREASPATFQWVFVGDDANSAGPNSVMSTMKWDSFPNWLKSTDRMYWISGKPGAGKSTLVKYILADTQRQTTQQCLDIWSPKSLIISHYFWRPGNPMQRSIKGLFCSLLFQLLQNSETSMRQLLKNRDEAFGRSLRSATVSSMKSDVTDWSLAELHSTLRDIMKTYDRPICMFLDGLDEVYPDQPSDLLEMIKELSVIGKTKMCLASRSEPPLQRRLYNIPQLRLQDLTAKDLKQYVRHEIRRSKISVRSEDREFMKSLAERAEGVFLWLVLVMKSVRNGFDNGDSINIIKERVDNLKGGDLESLYKDMWDRVSKDDPDTYRQTAALYFRLMLLYNRGVNEHLRIYGDNLSVFTMMLSTTELAEKTLDSAPQFLNLVPERTLLQSCKEVERIAEIYCFGLLEISENKADEVIEDMVSWYRGKYDKLLPYAQVRRTLVFIHRTAVDFLVNTAQGKEILSFDDTAEPSHAFRLVKANLAHACMFCVFTEKGKTGRRGNLASTHLNSIGSVRETYVDADESVIADYMPIMVHFQTLCDSERVFAGASSAEAFVCSGVDFFKAAAMYNWRCLVDFENEMKALDKGTLSETLHILCNLCFHESDDTEIFDRDALRFVRLLLTGGADPNWNGTTGFANIQSAGGEANPYICRRTPFVAFLSGILKHAQLVDYEAGSQWDSNFLWNDLTDMLVTLQTFISCGADLDEHVTMAIRRVMCNCASLAVDKSVPCQKHPEYATYWRWEYLFYNPSVFETGSLYICSFPTHKILNRVLSGWQSDLRRLSIKSTLLENVQSLVAYGTSKSSRMNDSMVMRLESSLTCPNRWSRKERRWGVATTLHQEQFANELMSYIILAERSLVTWKECSEATRSSRSNPLMSVIDGSHWVKQGSTSLEDVFDYLVRFRMFARYSVSRQPHSIRYRLELNGGLPAA